MAKRARPRAQSDLLVLPVVLDRAQTPRNVECVEHRAPAAARRRCPARFRAPPLELTPQEDARHHARLKTPGRVPNGRLCRVSGQLWRSTAAKRLTGAVSGAGR